MSYDKQDFVKNLSPIAKKKTYSSRRNIKKTVFGTSSPNYSRSYEGFSYFQKNLIKNHQRKRLNHSGHYPKIIESITYES